MRIALFSYEYPPETARGGVATCTYQTALMMRRLGHDVEVFAGSYTSSRTATESGLTVHRVKHDLHETFHEAVASVFLERHRVVGYDLLESPELMAEARGVMDQAPEVARVVKVHSPVAFLLEATHGRYQPPPLFERARLHLDAVLHGEKPYWAGAGRATPVAPMHKAMDAAERSLVAGADVVVTPSRHMGDRLAAEWGVDRDALVHVPNAFVPGDAILSLPLDTRTHRVTTIGRLEPLKGVFDLARAIALICKRNPDATFRLIGESQQSDIFGDVGGYLKKTLLRRHLGRVELLGPVPVDQVPRYLGQSDVCVFPSLLDNFPYVCLEAMAAGRAVVGTLGTGMAEMITDGETGRLVPQQSPGAIADAVVQLLSDAAQRTRIGAAARRHVADAYSSAVLGPMQQEAYTQALAARDQRLAAATPEPRPA